MIKIGDYIPGIHQQKSISPTLHFAPFRHTFALTLRGVGGISAARQREEAVRRARAGTLHFHLVAHDLLRGMLDELARFAPHGCHGCVSQAVGLAQNYGGLLMKDDHHCWILTGTRFFQTSRHG